MIAAGTSTAASSAASRRGSFVQAVCSPAAQPAQPGRDREAGQAREQEQRRLHQHCIAVTGVQQRVQRAHVQPQAGDAGDRDQRNAHRGIAAEAQRQQPRRAELPTGPGRQAQRHPNRNNAAYPEGRRQRVQRNQEHGRTPRSLDRRSMGDQGERQHQGHEQGGRDHSQRATQAAPPQAEDDDDQVQEQYLPHCPTPAVACVAEHATEHREAPSTSNLHKQQAGAGSESGKPSGQRERQ